MKPVLFFLSACCLLLACKKDKPPKPAPLPPVSQVFLKDVEMQNLPSPYYHFEYGNDGHFKKASFSSGQADYDIFYSGNRLNRMQNTSTANKDIIDYQYDGQGKVVVIRISNQSGIQYRRAFLEYDAHQRLIRIDWELKVNTVGFAQEQTLSFTYYADGNLKELRDEKFFISGRQNALVVIDRFEGYDDKINVEGFSLLHGFDQHLVLLPAVQLQRNNPAKNIRTGGGVNYTINYTYTYNQQKCPTHKVADMLIQNGDNAGHRVELNSWFTYYE